MRATEVQITGEFSTDRVDAVSGVQDSRANDERALTIAVQAIGFAESALQWTVQYESTRSPEDFGAIRFELGELSAEIWATRALLDRCLKLQFDKELSVPEATAAREMCTELEGKVVDACLQLLARHGYALRHPFSIRAYLDSRSERQARREAENAREIVCNCLRAKEKEQS